MDKEWYESWKPYVAITLIGAALAMAYVLYANDSTLGYVFPAVTLFVCFPIIMAGAYMWITGNGSRFINGVDWSKLNEEETKRTTSYIGLWMAVGIIVLMYGMSVLLSHMWIGLSVMGVSLVLMLITLLNPMFRKIDRPRTIFDSYKAFVAIFIITMVSLVPTTYLMTAESTSETVDVTLNDTSFTVKAPMFDHTFAYGDIDTIECVDNFDRGKRVWGYNTDNVCTGKFRSDTYGDYELAMYKDVSTCVVIYVGGDMYAFNQDSIDATVQLYNDIKGRMP